MEQRTEAIDALLPQTQCGLCGYQGCRPYAEALALGAANIDRCPPGGQTTLISLAHLLNIDPEPYQDRIENTKKMPTSAIIREDECIGCTKCIQACPVDAIIGAGKLMHSILADECTGCGLCIDPCPVDCIELIPLDLDQHEKAYDPKRARARHQAKKLRQIKATQAEARLYREKKQLVSKDNLADKQAIKAYVTAALMRSQKPRI